MTPTFLNPPIHFSRDRFRAYVRGLIYNYSNWIPRMPYLHNTGVPSLKQWQAMGATPQERWGASLNRYYSGMGWHAGPHLVACPDYIWVLCDLTKPGVAQSCSNQYAISCEMVGNYEIGGDDFSSGDGAKVRDNAAFAIATMADKIGWGDLSDFSFNLHGLHFHRDCKQDHHACPGSKVTKPDMLGRIASFRSAPSTPAAAPDGKAPISLSSTEDIQAALNQLGIQPLEHPDGVYGPITIARVKTFQKAHGCVEDGWVGTGPGSETGPAMIAALGKLG